jgi:hypothetical protein
LPDKKSHRPRRRTAGSKQTIKRNLFKLPSNFSLKNEKKLAKMEEKTADALEVAAQAHEKGKEEKADEIN